MKISKLIPLAALVVVTAFFVPGPRCEESDELSRNFAEFQHQYLQGHISAREYEYRKYEATMRQETELRHQYYQGHMTEQESQRLIDDANRQYAASYSWVSPGELARLQAAFRQGDAGVASPTGVMPDGTAVAVLDARAIGDLQRRYFQGHISAGQYEQGKFDLKEEKATEVRRQYYRGHISAGEARVLERRLERDYAGLYSPLTSNELDRMKRSLAQRSDPSLRQEFDQIAPTGGAESRHYPAPPAKSKAELLEDLLTSYKADRITPHQYQQERARILALPDR